MATSKMSSDWMKDFIYVLDYFLQFVNKQQSSLQNKKLNPQFFIDKRNYSQHNKIPNCDFHFSPS